MQRLIIDTDPGVDDAHAILMAAAHPQSRIEAILAVGGNVGIEHTVRNALTLVDVVGQPIPVYAGCAQPLLHFQEDAAFVHGSNGLGDAELPAPSGQAESQHAAVRLVEMVNREPGEFTLVALGPLTNIAVALQLDPQLPHKLKRFVDMGGAVTGKGNVKGVVSAEFNIYFDPEAAHIVFDAWARAGRELELVDWEATTRHGMPGDLLRRWMALGTPKANFFRAISEKTYTFIREKYGRDMLFGADPLAMAVVLESDIVTRSERHHTSIEIDGRYTRGQTTVDWSDRSGQPVNCQIALDIDLNRFHALMEAALQ